MSFPAHGFSHERGIFMTVDGEVGKKRRDFGLNTGDGKEAVVLLLIMLQDGQWHTIADMLGWLEQHDIYRGRRAVANDINVLTRYYPISEERDNIGRLIYRLEDNV